MMPLQKPEPRNTAMVTAMHGRVLVFLIFLFMLSGFTPLPQRLASQYKIRDFGATGGGVALETRAIQAAIDQCAITGGTVVVPAGTYRTGSLHLKSNVDLYLAAGALILGSTELKDYDERIPAFRSYNDLFLKYSLLYAEQARNISIRGEGTVDGQGWAFKASSTVRPDRYKDRPFLIRFAECTSLRIEGVTLRNSGMWMQHYLACEDLTIRGIRVYNHANKNNDMMDIDGCRNVVISDCIGDTDDDAITLKSTSPRLTENVTITNCVLSSHCNAIKFGTESTGGFRNITISNIVIKPSAAETVLTGRAGGISGLTFAIVDGGFMEGISVSHVTMDGPAVPFFIRLGNRARKYEASAPAPGVGTVRNIAIDHLTATNAGPIGCSVSGIPGAPVRDVRLSNIRITFAGGGTGEDAGRVMPELSDSYPESTAWGSFPAYGLYARHVEAISITGWTLDLVDRDLRPVMLLSDADDGIIDGLRAEADSLADAFIVAENSRTITVRHSSPEGQVKTFLSIRGKASQDFFLHGNVLWNALQEFTKENDARVVSEGVQR
ncbi:MAG: glycoside hydrolase [Bacteroidetes bacterium]|nr:glycoside hydrolase [Bacteroidota bacterium]